MRHNTFTKDLEIAYRISEFCEGLGTDETKSKMLLLGKKMYLRQISNLKCSPFRDSEKKKRQVKSLTADVSKNI
jgi:hypothetical protein